MTTPTTTSLFATVAVDQPVDATYTYLVPEALRKDVKPGVRVTVPLGRSNRLTPATVLSLSETPPEIATPTQPAAPEPADEASLFDAPPPPFQSTGGGGGKFKPIADVLRDVLPIPDDLLELARWIAVYYCAPIGMTLATMVPAAVKRGTRLPANLLISLADKTQPPEDQVAAGGGLRISSKTKKIFEQLHFFLQGGPKREPEVLDHAQIARPMLKRLIALGLLRMEREIKLPEHLPVGADTLGAMGAAGLPLSADQQVAADHIAGLLQENKFAVRLLHGVTGSGKTELYIRAIEKVVASGKRAIVLVPEISLTPQMVRRFTARFQRVAVLHSGLKDSERHQHYHAIASGWAQVVVGARSAIFAPAADIGLIVVDEEHDPSYKQDSLPKYHGRDVAIRRAQLLNVPVLLGSATPALESWHNAQSHPSWALLSLRSRPLGTQMPRVLVVDMKGQMKERRGLHILSTLLEHHLKQTLQQKKQAIFLLNRRGYAHYVMCPRCDWVLMCENCDATMVVHRTRPEEGPAGGGGAPSGSGRQPLRGKVQCHYCLTAQMLPEHCPLCQARLTHLGQGTQRAEDELLRKFPGLRLKRMDSDSMHDAADYQETLDAFGSGQIDLLIGTQMISKGLDFPNVHLVGVLNSDLAMTIPDFRAAERTFQLICQVAGLAGRAMGRGDETASRRIGESAKTVEPSPIRPLADPPIRPLPDSPIRPLADPPSPATVIVQTFQPNEPAIAHACRHDYLGFVASELPHRQEFGYPPYGRLVRLVLSHKGYSKVHAFGQELTRLITALTQKLSLPIRVQGPFPPPMERLVEMYRVEILLFAHTPAPLQRLLASLRARGVLASKQVQVAVDVDPIRML